MEWDRARRTLTMSFRVECWLPSSRVFSCCTSLGFLQDLSCLVSMAMGYFLSLKTAVIGEMFQGLDWHGRNRQHIIIVQYGHRVLGKGMELGSLVMRLWLLQGWIMIQEQRTGYPHHHCHSSSLNQRGDRQCLGEGGEVTGWTEPQEICASLVTWGWGPWLLGGVIESLTEVGGVAWLEVWKVGGWKWLS